MIEDKQTVIISGQNNCHISLDGPSLRIQQKDRSERRIPIRKISHISSFGNCKWEHFAILACSDHGIPVHFCKQDGSLRASVLPPMQNTSYIPLIELIEKTIKDRKTGEEIKQWMANQRQGKVNECQQKIAQKYRFKFSQNETPLEKLARKKLNNYGWIKLKKILYSLLKADVQTMLWKDNIKFNAAILEVHQLNLIEYLAYSIYCDIIPKVLNDLIPRKKHFEKPGINLEKVTSFQQKYKCQITDCYNSQILTFHRALIEKRNER